MWTSTPAGCLIGDNCNSDVGGEPDALKGASPVRRGAEGRSLRDATRPTLRLPAYYYPRDIPPTPALLSQRQDAIDAFFAAIPARVRHGGDEAYYCPGTDRIQLPHPGSFASGDAYASTRGHETAHWSGSPARLARTFGKRFGDRAYAMEELTAELCASMICADLGLPTSLHDSHASYVSHWIGILRADNSAIFTAAARAEQAFAYLRGFSAPATDEPASPVALAA